MKLISFVYISFTSKLFFLLLLIELIIKQVNSLNCNNNNGYFIHIIMKILTNIPKEWILKDNTNNDTNNTHYNNKHKWYVNIL